MALLLQFFITYNETMKQFILLLNWVFFASLLQAQIAPKVTTQAVKSLKPATQISQGLSSYAGARGAVMGVDYALTRAALAQQQALTKTATPPAVPVVQRPQRSFWQQTKRDFQAFKLHQERQVRDFRALQKAEAQYELERQKAALPQLQPELSFEVENFADYLPLKRQLPRPDLPFIAEPGTLAYRGLALAADGADFRNILTNGLRIQDSGEESNTLRMAFASHGGYHAMKFLIDNPVINITFSPRSAVYWGAKRLGESKPVLALIKIRGKWDGDGLEVVTHDIPADQIEELAVRLNIDGNLTWCKVTLNENGTFTLTPYQVFYTSK